MNYQTAREIELAVAEYLDWRLNVVVPNVRDSIGLRHEADLIRMRYDGMLTEVEIKVTKSDLIADKEKPHHRSFEGHTNRHIWKLYFAMPRRMTEHRDHVPVHAGVISVDEDGNCKCLRRAQENPKAVPLDEKQRAKLIRVGYMRMWNLKRTLLDLPAINALAAVTNGGPEVDESYMQGEIAAGDRAEPGAGDRATEGGGAMR